MTVWLKIFISQNIQTLFSKSQIFLVILSVGSDGSFVLNLIGTFLLFILYLFCMYLTLYINIYCGPICGMNIGIGRFYDGRILSHHQWFRMNLVRDRLFLYMFCFLSSERFHPVTVWKPKFWDIPSAMFYFVFQWILYVCIFFYFINQIMNMCIKWHSTGRSVIIRP